MLVILQIIAFLFIELHDVTLVRVNAPFLVLARGLAGGREPGQVFAAGPPERSDGHFEIAVFKLLDVLYAAFAVTAFADDQRPLVILKTGGHNLAAAGAVPIHQAHHREV